MEHETEYHYENNGKLEMQRDDYKIIKTKNNVITKIEKIITIKNLTDSFTNRLTKYSMCVIKSIIKVNPEFIISIDNIVIRNITDITNNGIEANDIYEIIIIISKIYNIILVMNFNLQKQIEITAEICGYIVRFIISVSIQEHNVKNKELLVSFEKIIDACVKLLQLKNPKAMRLLSNNDNNTTNNNGEQHNYNSDDEYENENEAPVVVKEYGSCCF
jgi:hypothetical protein